jgi:DNA polymerase-3 subunit delta'
MLMERGGHPDFHLIQPTNKDGAVDRDDGELRTDRANDLVHDAALRPLEGKWRIFLIQDMHLANASFSNKILKTLEEPPPQTILLLTATDRKSVLPTIASRCQVLELRALDRAAVERALQEGGHASAEEADLLARLANGRMGWALQQVQHPERRSERLEQLETLRRLLGADRIARLDFAASLVTKRDRDNRELFGMLALWTTWWRDVMLVQAGCDDAVSNADQLAEVRRQAAAVDGNTVRAALQTLQQIDGYLHHTVNARLALEVLMLKLPKLEGSGS